MAVLFTVVAVFWHPSDLTFYLPVLAAFWLALGQLVNSVNPKVGRVASAVIIVGIIVLAARNMQVVLPWAEPENNPEMTDALALADVGAMSVVVPPSYGVGYYLEYFAPEVRVFWPDRFANYGQLREQILLALDSGPVHILDEPEWSTTYSSSLVPELSSEFNIVSSGVNARYEFSTLTVRE